MESNHLLELTKRIRYNILTSTTAAGSGHPSSSLSAVELMTALWFDGHFHYDEKNPSYVLNDRMIFSKGHASPLLYSLYQAAGWIEHEELLTLRKFTSRLEGHPTPELPWVDVGTGSLGQGLSIGIGMALGAKLRMKNEELRIEREPMVYVLMGDSEFTEGQIYEALQVASHYKLNNLVGFLDVNRLGQRGATMLGWDIATYEKRVKSFGWNTIVIEEGNDLDSVQKAFEKLPPTTDKLQANKPTMIIAKTQKGAGISSIADKDGWHGKALPNDMLDAALGEIGDFDKKIRGEVVKPEKIEIAETARDLPSSTYNLPATPTATREAYGAALKLIAADKRVVVLDAETSNSTFAETMKEVAPERFFEMFIAEQNMVSVALGMSKVGFIPYASSFAAFLTRAYDQIRMAQYAGSYHLNIIGSHAGVSIGEDGSSQMALEDLAMMRALLTASILYPSDPVSTVKLVDAMRSHDGLTYLRLTRAKTASLYSLDDTFTIGGSKVVKSSEKDTAVVVAAGITVHEALKAHEQLKQKQVDIAVIDAYSVKPLDVETIKDYASKTGHVIIVEDHYPDGGLGDAVRQALQGMAVTITHLAVRKIPRSGTPEELLAFEEIDADAIIRAVQSK